jgi:hypothetical protein
MVAHPRGPTRHRWWLGPPRTLMSSLYRFHLFACFQMIPMYDTQKRHLMKKELKALYKNLTPFNCMCGLPALCAFVVECGSPCAMSCFGARGWNRHGGVFRDNGALSRSPSVCSGSGCSRGHRTVVALSVCRVLLRRLRGLRGRHAELCDGVHGWRLPRGMLGVALLGSLICGHTRLGSCVLPRQDIVETGGCDSESALANISWRILKVRVALLPPPPPLRLPKTLVLTHGSLPQHLFLVVCPTRRSGLGVHS